MGWFDVFKKVGNVVGKGLRKVGSWISENKDSVSSAAADALEVGGNGLLGYLGTKKGAEQTQKYNLALMKQQYNYAKKSAATEFGYNKYFQNQQYKQQNALQTSAYQLQNQLQQKQMNYETQMSNTAHQREVTDLRNAGLNPILSANGGASTPSIGMGSIGTGSAGGGSVSVGDVSGQSAPHSDYGQQLQNAISNAFQKRALDIDTERAKAETNERYAKIENEIVNNGKKILSETNLNKIEAEIRKMQRDFLPVWQKKELEKANAEIRYQSVSAKIAEIRAASDVLRNHWQNLDTSSAIQYREKQNEYQDTINKHARLKLHRDLNDKYKSINSKFGVNVFGLGGFDYGLSSERY